MEPTVQWAEWRFVGTMPGALSALIGIGHLPTLLWRADNWDSQDIVSNILNHALTVAIAIYS